MQMLLNFVFVSKSKYTLLKALVSKVLIGININNCVLHAHDMHPPYTCHTHVGENHSSYKGVVTYFSNSLYMYELSV